MFYDFMISFNLPFYFEFQRFNFIIKFDIRICLNISLLNPNTIGGYF